MSLAEVPGYVDFLFLAEPDIDQAAWAKAIAVPGATDVLAETIDAYTSLGVWDADSLKSVVDAAADSRGLKLGKVQAPIRIAITGRTIGPPLFEALELLGRDETLARLRRAQATVG